LSPPVPSIEKRLAFGLGVLEVLQEHVGVGVLEVEAGIFLFGLQENVAIADFVVALRAPLKLRS
jgi:hypothetical protein